MHRARYFVEGLTAERLISQWVTSIMIAVHLGLGAVIITGGPARFSLPSYKPLIDVTNGHVWIWGAISLVAAALMMTPFRWPNIVGLWVGMVWMIVWTALFLVSAINYPTSASTPWVAYGGFAMIDAALLTVRVLDRPCYRRD